MIIGITGSFGAGEKCAGHISQGSLRDIVSLRNNVSSEWTVPVRKGGGSVPDSALLSSSK